MGRLAGCTEVAYDMLRTLDDVAVKVIMT